MRNLVFLAIVAVLGCSAQPPKAQVTNYETKGNLQSKAVLGCVPLSAVTSQHTPADIYPGVAACIKAGAYEKAVPLYALAGTFGRFDQLRVTDATARQAIQVLQMNNFGDLTKEQQDNFRAVMSPALDAGPSLTVMCAAIARVGPPKYAPTYMVQHGMNAFLGSAGGGVKADFDSTKGWRDSLVGYLHCP